MDYGFRAYRPRTRMRKHEQIAMTITSVFSMRLTAAAVTALGKPDYVSLAYDPTTRTIAITPTTYDDPTHLKLARERLKSGLEPGHIAAEGFCRDLHIGATFHTPVPGQARDTVLYFRLPDTSRTAPETTVDGSRDHPLKVASGR